MNKGKSRGFTLIELLVVIAIIGLLAGLIGVSVSTARKKGRDARRAADIKSIQTALELFNLKNGYYPKTNTDGLDSKRVTGSAALTWLCGLSPTYMDVVPLDPSNTVTDRYFYTGEANGADYKIAAKMEEGASSKLAINDSGTYPSATNPASYWFELFSSGGQTYSLGGAGTNACTP